MALEFNDLLVLFLALLNLIQAIVFAAFAFAAGAKPPTPEKPKPNGRVT